MTVVLLRTIVSKPWFFSSAFYSFLRLSAGVISLAAVYNRRQTIYNRAAFGQDRQGKKMGLLIKLLTIFALGVAELWAAAPAGVAMGLEPVLVCLIAAAGAVSGGTVVILLGERVQAWLERKHKREKLEERRGLLVRVWQRYGVVGWGLLAPLLVGSPLGAAFGLALGAPPRRLLPWLAAGSLLWSVVFSALSALGWHLLGH
jgi:hypothetical protein